MIVVFVDLWRFRFFSPRFCFYFFVIFLDAERFLTEFCKSARSQDALGSAPAEFQQSFSRILGPIFDQVGSRHVPQIAQQLFLSAHGASQSDAFNNFLTIFAPLPFGVAFRTDFWSVWPFKIVLPPQREHDFEKITFFEKALKIEPPGTSFGTQNGPEVMLESPKFKKNAKI